jgi:CheY-like chemotaxis protein
MTRRGGTWPLAEGGVDAPAAQEKPTSHTRRVLVVDDHTDAGDMLGELLRALGHEAEVARDAAEALALAERHSFDVALLDLGLPDMNGYELGARLRARYPALAVIVLSGFAQEKNRAETARHGFDAHLAKPVELADLADALARTRAKSD